MGFELDLRALTEGDAATLARVTAWFKANRAWMHAGTIHRCDCPDPAVTAEVQVAADGSRFVLFAGVTETPVQHLPRPLPLAGLEPTARYRLHLVNPQDAPPQSRWPVALKTQDLTLTGALLMTQGLNLPLAWPATLWVVEGTRLQGADHGR
jgi:alpha-galactosidase